MSLQRLMPRDFCSGLQIPVIEPAASAASVYFVRNANSWARSDLRNLQSVSEFPGDSDACSSWQASGLHVFRGSQPWERGVSGRTLGEVGRIRVRFITSQRKSE